MKDTKPVIYWLLSGCILIFIMVIVGGITRLTHSGLSIANYQLIAGTIPPLNAQEWDAAFDLYKQYPEYQKINHRMTLEEFKDIFFWEWIHRVIGRVIGLVFMLPFAYFLITKKLSRSTIRKCLVLMLMGSTQGFLGWYMVKSGLVDRPDVSHYRLAMHLTTAFLTFAYTLWVALDLIYAQHKERGPQWSGMKNILRLGYLVLVIQIIYGAFVAGLDAGWIHNHWPKMSDGLWMHETVTEELVPVWKNFVEGKSGVQFVHRTLAYLVVGLIGWASYLGFKRTELPAHRGALKSLLVLVGVQFLLGVLTLLLQVPVALGLAHQVVAFLLLANMTFTVHVFRHQ
ncbi:MAG: COX15/CtaA family protein [Flavobacteriaceae bacterium]|nr:COX15/CtaA family protein [Flavobacteriaceae bacterium]MDG1962060.1 COX15/CtaA family protein [Flavobacteriaceae bacterium]